MTTTEPPKVWCEENAAANPGPNQEKKEIREGSVSSSRMMINRRPERSHGLGRLVKQPRVITQYYTTIVEKASGAKHIGRCVLFLSQVVISTSGYGRQRSKDQNECDRRKRQLSA